VEWGLLAASAWARRLEEVPLEEGVEDNLGTAAKEVNYRSQLGHKIVTYLVWGRAIHMIRTNLKM
jgi:hypothetical protein